MVYNLIFFSIQRYEEEHSHANHPFTLESTAGFMFYKILSAQKYGIGKKVFKYLGQFKQACQNSLEDKNKAGTHQVISLKFKKDQFEISPNNILLTKSDVDVYLQLEQLMYFIEEVVDNLFSEHNFGRSETQTVMPYCQISVEKYLYSKVFDDIYKIYRERERKNDEQFRIRQHEINSTQTTIQIFRNLQLNEKYWLVREQLRDEGKNEEITAEKIDHDQNQEEQQIPYVMAIQELEKLNVAQNPREQFKCAIMMHSMMRASVLDFHNSKYELSSMDDELPVVIYILLNSKVENLFTQICIIDDFVNLDPSIQTEKRLITNLKVIQKIIPQFYKLFSPLFKGISTIHN